jgi:hypothetical protein
MPELLMAVLIVWHSISSYCVYLISASTFDAMELTEVSPVLSLM